MRALHIHPSRMCNLQCPHCRSESGPLERQRLDSRLLVRAIDDAAALGYNLLSISGGEPLLYPELDQLASAGRAAGMMVSLASNGTLVHDGRLARIRHAVQRVTITLDGPPGLHNEMRGSARAFEMMESNLGVLRQLDLEFGIRYSLTPASAMHLRWIAGWAAAHGAAFLQVAPVSTSDSAAVSLPGLDLEEIRRQVDALQEIVPEGFPICLDALERDAAIELVSLWLQGKGRPLSPLVIEADGAVSPWSYGFPRVLRIGSIRENSLANLYRFWEVRCGDRFRRVMELVLHQLGAEDTPALVQLPRLLRHAAARAVALIPTHTVGDEPESARAAFSC